MTQKNFLMNMGIINVNSTSFNSSSNFTYNYGVLNLENVNLSYFSKFLNYNSICLNHSEISQFSGSIENYGNLIIDSSDFSQGNPIINNDICNITNTKFHDYRIASYVYFESYGSILINNGNANILNSEFKNCTLGLSQFGTGSGLLNSGNLSVISSVFENVFNDVYIVYPGGSEFSTYLGNVIYNEGNLVANYNVFVNNTKLYHTGKTVNDRYDIYNSGGRILSCDFNWWGSNNPAFENLTNFDVGNWVVMDLDSEYSSIGLDERISINVCLNRLNDGSEIPDLEKLPVRKVIFDCIIQTLDENLSDNNYLSSTGGNLTGGAFTTEFLGNDVISGFVVYVNIDNFILESVIDVGKYNASLSFDYENITYFDDFTFSLNLSTLGDCDYNLSGKFNLILNGTVYEGVLNSDCTGSLLIEKLSAGNYDMKIVYMGNEYYARAFGYANLTVERYSPMISAIAEDIVVGQKVIVNVTSNIDSIEGFCKLTINNRNYSMYIHKGTASLKISNLQVGDYVVTVFYQGSENFMPANATIHFSVYRNITEKIATTTSIFVNDVMVGENATISVIVGPEDVYGYGVLTINDVAMDIYIFNGSYNLNLTDLAVGSYDVDVRYNGSYYFINSSNSTSFEVKGKEIVLDVDVQILTYEMATVNVKVSPDNISGTFIVGVNDYYYYLPFENGSSSFSMPLRDGENNLVVYCPSVDDYAFAFYNETFELKRPNATVIHYSDMVTYAIVNSGIRDGEYFKLNLTDSYGHPLVKKTVLIGFNGKVYSRTTNASGGIRLQIKLASPGTYTFAICFLGDDVYAGCFAVSKITVVRSNVNIIAPSVSFKKSETKKIVSVTLRTPQGKLLKNRIVTLYVNGKSYSARTDSKGLAKISVSLSSVGIYTYTVSFSGDTQCYKATKTGKITIK